MNWRIAATIVNKQIEFIKLNNPARNLDIGRIQLYEIGQIFGSRKVLTFQQNQVVDYSVQSQLMTSFIAWFVVVYDVFVPYYEA